MRVEHQGYVEVQPAYQHVGYVSAALSNTRAGVGGTGVVSATVLLLVALILAQRLRSRTGYIASAAIVVLGMSAYAAWGAVTIRHATERQAVHDLYEVITGLERMCRSTEEWSDEHGRLPTPDEWRREWPGSGSRRTLEYRTVDEPGTDGQRYVIVSKPGKRDPKGPSQDIPSTWLGPDGLHSTGDDDPALARLLEASHANEYGRRSHAREARKPLSP